MRSGSIPVRFRHKEGAGPGLLGTRGMRTALIAAVLLSLGCQSLRALYSSPRSCESFLDEWVGADVSIAIWHLGEPYETREVRGSYRSLAWKATETAAPDPNCWIAEDGQQVCHPARQQQFLQKRSELTVFVDQNDRLVAWSGTCSLFAPRIREAAADPRAP